MITLAQIKEELVLIQEYCRKKDETFMARRFFSSHPSPNQAAVPLI